MRSKIELFSLLATKIDHILENESDKEMKLQMLCKLLKKNVPYYNWVGFYLVEKEKRNELLLGPFEGDHTEHVKILFGKGICGQAAELKETFLVQDVSKERNYLSCSNKVKSEIVVPILKNKEVIGELDIDSHSLSPFSKEDRVFLEKVASMASRVL